MAATTISAPCSGSPGPCRWGAAGKHGSTQGEGHRDPWQELPEEWAQKSELMQASIRLQKARAWLLSMLSWGGCSQCRQGTCHGCLPGHCPEGASSSSLEVGGVGAQPQIHGTDLPQHNVTGRRFAAGLRICWICQSVSHSVVSTLCHPMDSTRLLCPWILQARILEWVAMPSSRGSSQPRD